MTLMDWLSLGMALLVTCAVSFSENLEDSSCGNLASNKDICCFISEQFFPAIGLDQQADFVSSCQDIMLPSGKTPDDETAHRASDFLVDWYNTLSAMSLNASSNQFFGLDESAFCPTFESETNWTLTCEQWHCLTDRSCTNTEQQRVPSAFLRRSFELFYYASNLQLQISPIWIDDFDKNRYQILNESVLCLVNASCCNGQFLGSRYSVSAENINQTARFDVKMMSVPSMSHCDFMREWILPDDKLLRETCEQYPVNATPQMCYVQAASWYHLYFSAAYSEVGLLTQIHYLLQPHSNELIGRLEYLGFKPAEADPRRINFLRRRVTVFAILLQLAGISIVIVNAYVLFVIHCVKKEQANVSAPALSHRVTVFLRNILALNIVFGLEESVSIAVTFLISRMSSHSLKMSDPQNFDNIWNFAVRLMTGGTANTFQFVTMIRVCLRTSLQLSSLLLFIFFGTFQALPLILPFKMRKSAWLDFPGYAAAIAWAAGLTLACTICVPSDVYYKYYIDYDTDARNFSANESQKLEKLLTGEATDVSQKVAFASFLAVCSFLSIAVFVYALIVWKVATLGIRRKPTLIRQFSAESRTSASAVKGVVNVCLAQLILLLSNVVYVGFLAHVHVDSNRVMKMTYQEKYGIEAATHYISFYLAARLLVSMEPLATPILILCRYDCLSAEMRHHAGVLLLFAKVCWRRLITCSFSHRAVELPSSIGANTSSVPAESDTAAVPWATNAGAKHILGGNRQVVSGGACAMRTYSSAFTISCRSELEETVV